MARIPRVLQRIFGSSSGTNEMAQFGSLAQGTPEFTNDIGTIQALGAWLEGWYAAVMGVNSPTIQDMNAAFLVFSTQLAYVLQSGVPEWNDETTYYLGNIVSSDGVQYVSLADNNLDNPVTDSTKWRVPGGMVTLQTADYTLDPTDDVVSMFATSADLTATLPAIADVPVGKRFTIKKTDQTAHAIVVAADGSEVIDGSASYTLSTFNESITVFSTGVVWFII